MTSGLPILRLGSTDRTVRLWGRALTRTGYLPLSRGVLQMFDNLAVRATRQWQEDRGLSPDGVPGPNTWGKLAVEPSPWPKRTWGECILVDGNPMCPPQGVIVRNFLNPDVVRFAGKSRVGVVVNEVNVHESVTRSADATTNVLLRRGLGVQLLVAPPGAVMQHGDLASDRMTHAGGHNGPSIGIEHVNPYYPSCVSDHDTWPDVIDAPWAHRGEYVVPPLAQLEAGAKIIGWLAGERYGDVRIGAEWIGVADGRMALGRVPGADSRRSGIYAHHYTAHADGCFPVLYAWLRLQAGLEPDNARAEAIRLATGARGSVDVSVYSTKGGA